jgi:hypothetical protein
MMRIIWGLAIATTLVSGASAQNKMVYGAGMITCGEWQQYRSSGNKPGSYQAQAWIDGYLSGSNASGDGPDFIAPKPSDIAYYAWIDNYCGQNPLDSLLVAAFRLKRELLSRAPAR